MTSCTSESQHPPISNSLPPPPEDLVLPIQWPTEGHVTLPWVHNLMSVFDFSSRHLPPSHFSSVLPVAAFDSLLLAASKLLHKEPNCLTVSDVTSHVVVVGDVHGQLHDVLSLLKETGYPADNRVYVFNGDYVDRGAWGLETFLILLAWKVLMPKKVYMLRGNHESKYCTSVYGFENEVLVKYRDHNVLDGGDEDRIGKHVYRKCLGCFEGLPLASVINGSVYTAHGGLFRSVDVGPVRGKGGKGKKKKKRIVGEEKGGLVLGSLEELGRARRSVLDPPWEGANLIPGDVLWSDPSMKPGLSPNKVRGIGLIWGPDCTEEFLKKFQLKVMLKF